MHLCRFTIRSVRPGQAILLCAALLLSACSESPSQSVLSQVASNDTTISVDKGFDLAMPAGVASMRAVIVDNLYALVTVNGEVLPPFNQSSQGDQDLPVSTNFRIARGETLIATIRWFETLPGNFELQLASHTIRQVVTDAVTLSVNSRQYETELFDQDNDGFSNLAERRAGSDPLNPNDIPTTRPDVLINRISAVEAPIIDGLYDSIYTDAPATFNDENGELLYINNLMVDQGATRADGTPEFRWFALHDDDFLYVFVLGEPVGEANPIRDSEEMWQDDSIDIFIDADNSKGSFYDANDRHVIIPLLTDSTDSAGPNTTSFVAGPNSAPLPTIAFSTCVCRSGQHTWEVRLPLDGFDIKNDTLFGIEVQLNLDHDGGARDAKWGWFHPSRRTVDVDNTYRFPSFMGTAVLN